jgi:hypothetical protein
VVQARRCETTFIIRRYRPWPRNHTVFPIPRDGPRLAHGGLAQVAAEVGSDVGACMTVVRGVSPGSVAAAGLSRRRARAAATCYGLHGRRYVPGDK